MLIRDAVILANGRDQSDEQGRKVYEESLECGTDDSNLACGGEWFLHAALVTTLRLLL